MAELTDTKEVTSAAVASLQAVLTRLEATPVGRTLVPTPGASAEASRGAGTGAAQGASLVAQRRAREAAARGTGAGGEAEGGLGLQEGQLLACATAAPRTGRAAAAGSSVAALSRELVRAKLAEVEAEKRSRAAARAEVQLRQRLLQVRAEWANEGVGLER